MSSGSLLQWTLPRASFAFATLVSQQRSKLGSLGGELCPCPALQETPGWGWLSPWKMRILLYGTGAVRAGGGGCHFSLQTDRGAHPQHTPLRGAQPLRGQWDLRVASPCSGVGKGLSFHGCAGRRWAGGSARSAASGCGSWQRLAASVGSSAGWAPLCAHPSGDERRLLLSPRGYCKAPAAAALRVQPCPPLVLAGPGASGCLRGRCWVGAALQAVAEEEGKDTELRGALRGGLGSKSRCAAWSGRSQPGAGLFLGAAGADVSAVFRSPALQQRLTALGSGGEAPDRGGGRASDCRRGEGGREGGTEAWAEQGFGRQGKGDGRAAAPGPWEQWACQFGGMPSPQLLLSVTGLEVADLHLCWSREDGTIPSRAGGLQMCLASASPWPPGYGALPRAQWQLLAEGQGLLGFGSTRQKHVAGTDGWTRHGAWRGLRRAGACRRVLGSCGPRKNQTVLHARVVPRRRGLERCPAPSVSCQPPGHRAHCSGVHSGGGWSLWEPLGGTCCAEVLQESWGSCRRARHLL